MKCEDQDCRAVATRIVRAEDPQVRLVRYLCKSDAKKVVDTTIPKRSRSKYIVQRLPAWVRA